MINIYDVRVEVKATLLNREPIQSSAEQMEFHYLQTKLDFLADKFKDVCERMLQYSMEISTLEKEGV